MTISWAKWNALSFTKDMFVKPNERADLCSQCLADSNIKSNDILLLQCQECLIFYSIKGFQAAVAQLGSRSFYISPIKLHLNLYTIPSCLVLLIVVPMIILVYRYIGT